MSFELVGQHWHATNISFLLWNSSLFRDCMFEVIDEHIRETERSIIAWLCFGDFPFFFFFWDSDSMSDKYSTHYLLFSHRDKLLAVMGLKFLQSLQEGEITKSTKRIQENLLQVSCLWFRFLDSLPVSMTHVHSFFSFSFVFLSHASLFFFLFRFRSTHLAVLVAHGEQSNGAVGVAAAVANGGHVPVPHDWHGGQRLARGVRVRDGVALPARRGQLWAECEVLLHLLVLGLVEMELRVLQVTLDLRQKTEASV